MSNGIATRKQQQQQQLGEDVGVARLGGQVVLDSDTAVMGRGCSNPSCMAIEGVGTATFKRCGNCKQRYYCSVHCQRTDWQRRHAKQCPQLKAMAAAAPAQDAAKVSAAAPAAVSMS
eukprot:GHRR01018500.1.p2 GENE.GHRR01018500.1~~GHRR01018500.1.p2  ORF type:complete len:117 (+),score=42.56 GHRR01018500.1:288-638(+)